MSGLSNIYEQPFEKQKTGDWRKLAPIAARDETPCDNNNDNNSYNNNVAGMNALNVSVNAPWGGKQMGKKVSPPGEDLEIGGQKIKTKKNIRTTTYSSSSY